MRLFKDKKSSGGNYDMLPILDFSNKTFHLLANFDGCSKKEFAEKIESLGGKCRGFDSSKHLCFSKTDCFVVGGKEYREEQGKKIKEIDEYNKKNPENRIPKITQSHCEELIDQYRPPNP